MDEREWLGSGDYKPMLTLMDATANSRRLRLFAVACCLRFCPPDMEAWCRDAILTAERFADGVATADELQQADAAFPPIDWSDWSRSQGGYDVACRLCIFLNSADGSYPSFIAGVAAEQVVVNTSDDAHVEQCAAVAGFLRCLFGNPFRPVVPDPAWLTSTAVGLAEAIYDGRRFGDLPILADALEDAGCDDAAVLQHCRDGGEHARGCWVVDMVLGKS